MGACASLALAAAAALRRCTDDLQAVVAAAMVPSLQHYGYLQIVGAAVNFLSGFGDASVCWAFPLRVPLRASRSTGWGPCGGTSPH